MEPFQIGDVVAGKYEITRVLGRGGMGVVVAARHRELGEDVALKFLQPSLTDRPESYARFAREARTATRIKSEHVARVYDVGTEGGVPFIVMECLTGEDLARVIKARGPLPSAAHVVVREHEVPAVDAGHGGAVSALGADGTTAAYRTALRALVDALAGARVDFAIVAFVNLVNGMDGVHGGMGPSNRREELQAPTPARRRRTQRDAKPRAPWERASRKKSASARADP